MPEALAGLSAMFGFSATLANFARYRQQFEDGSRTDMPPDGRLVEILEFGANPGNLRIRCFVSEDLPTRAPLVSRAICRPSSVGRMRGRWGLYRRAEPR